MDMIIQWAKGNKPGPSPATGDQMSTAVAYYQGKIHQAGIWKDHKVNYKPPGGKWYAVDVKSYASTGATIAIDPATGNMCISYTNKDGAACTYEKGPTGTAWRWTNQGGIMLV
jgi:cytolysin (calcineurin-like family phosphatase)